MINTHSPSSQLANAIRRMEEKIAKDRPQLIKIKEEYGNLSYFDYIKQRTRLNLNKAFISRKDQVVTVIKDEVTRTLGSAIASDVEKQLARSDSISTTEHTCPFGNTNMLSASLHHSIPMFGNQDARFKNILVLACSGSSFSNDVYFSRGFQFHAVKDTEVIDNTLAFFGRSIDPQTVINAAPYTIDTVKEMKKKISTLLREENITQQSYEKIDTLLDEVYSTPHPLSAIDFVDQVTITNYSFWKRLFPSWKKEDVPNYIMLSQEKILLKLLLKYHIHENTEIHKFIFDSKYHTLIEKYFDGITGAFKMDRSSGTFLFWGYSKKDNTRSRLFREGNMLVNKDKTFSLELTPHAIEQAIINKDIYPGLLLTFITLSFYYGLLLSGGPSQTSYLTAMKMAYLKMMREVGDENSVRDIEQSFTDTLVFSRPHLAFWEVFGERIAATPLDMYLYQNPLMWQKIISATKSITVNDFFAVHTPAWYRQIAEEEKEEELSQITRQDVEKYLGLDQKILPIGTIEKSE